MFITATKPVKPALDFFLSESYDAGRKHPAGDHSCHQEVGNLFDGGVMPCIARLHIFSGSLKLIFVETISNVWPSSNQSSMHWEYSPLWVETINMCS